MWGALITAIATIASSSIQAGVSSKQNREAIAEASKLAEQQRQDILKQRENNNAIVSQQLRLNQNKIDFSRRMFADQKTKLERQKKDIVEATSAKKIEDLSANINRPSFLFKNRQRII